MTVRANLELGGVSLRDLSLTRRRMDEIAFELFPVLRDKADAQAGNLSGGEQKMLEIGRAMLLEPRLLLVDEPSVGLSPILVRQVFALLRDLRDRGVTVLMVEQNAKRALETSDYGMVLQQGRLALAGRAAEVLEHPEIGHLFLGGAMRGRRVSTPTTPPGPPSPRDRHNVVLTGFMGTGKTTVGRLLADELGYEFVDTDELIEQRHGSIVDIFATRGEEAFRRLEREVAAELARRSGLVISTGRPDDARSRQRARPQRQRSRLLPGRHPRGGARAGHERCLARRAPLLRVPDPRQRIVELMTRARSGLPPVPPARHRRPHAEAVALDLQAVASAGPAHLRHRQPRRRLPVRRRRRPAAVRPAARRGRGADGRDHRRPRR